MYAFFHDHSLVILLTAASVVNFCWLYQTRDRLHMKLYAVLPFTVLHVLYGVLTVRLFAALEGVPGGMSLFGAVFLMPAAYYAGAKLFKRPPAEVFDIFTICLVATLFFARINCLVSGCCLGRQIFHQSEVRWPTRETELLFYIVFLLLLAPRVRRGRTNGTIYPIYMAAYGLFRMIIECFRESTATSSIFHLSHVWAVITFCLGMSILMEMKKRTATGSHSKGKWANKRKAK